MRLLQFSSFAFAAALLAGSTTVFADSHNAPPSPPPSEGLTDSVDASMPQPNSRPIAGSYYANNMQAGYGAEEHEHHDHHDRMRDAHHPHMGYDFGIVDDTVMYQGHWVGSMTGSWNGGPERTWQGTFDSTNGQTHWHGQYVDHEMGYAPQREYHSGYARQGYGYGYRYAAPEYEEVFVPSQPIITKTVRTYVTYVDVPVKTHYVYKRVWHRAYHPVCGCAAPRPRPHHPHVIQGS